MAYDNKTVKYQLESPTVGEQMDTQSEQRTAQIIDNNLYGAVRMHSGGHGIIRLGIFGLSTNGGSGNYTVSLVESKAQSKPVIEAFISQIYVFTENGIQWTGLADSTIYYLGVRLVESTTQSSLQRKEVQSWINTTGDIPTDGLLLATLTIDGSGNGTFDYEAENVIVLPVLGNHMGDSQNPHGTKLFQDSIVSSGLNVLGTLEYDRLQVDNFIISGSAIISGNVTVRGNLAVSGTLAIGGRVSYDELFVQNLKIPNNLTVGYLSVRSGMDIYPQSTFRRSILVNSGVTVDGFDPSQGIGLINGNNADHLHTHNLGAIVPVKAIHFSPEYFSTVLSGEIAQHSASGSFMSKRAFGGNYYEFQARTSGAAILVTRTVLPFDFERLDRIEVRNVCKKEANLSGNNIRTSVFDKDGTELTVSPIQFTNIALTNTSLAISGGQLLPNNSITIMNRLWSVSGVTTNLGDMSLFYVPKGGEKTNYTWTDVASGNNILQATSIFNGLRYNPPDIKLEKMVISSSLALSGNTVVGLRINDINNPTAVNLPSTYSKPTLSFGAGGASYQSNTVNFNPEFILSGNTFIQANIDLLASGSRDLTVQLIGRRI